MQIDVISGQAPLQARQAVLLYGRAEARDFEYCSVHAVGESETGDLRLEAGVPATLTGLQALFATLDPSGLDRPHFISPRILSRGARWLVWWSPPCKRRVWFKADKIGQKSAEVPHPGLIFAVHPRGWSIYAVKGKGRPRPGTRLYQAPYFNVWDSGMICTGSARCPKGAEASNPDAWETAFFESFFTHPNINTPNGLLLHKKGPIQFWKEMLAGKYAAFPNEVMVPVDLTVAELLDDIGRAM